MRRGALFSDADAAASGAVCRVWQGDSCRTPSLSPQFRHQEDRKPRPTSCNSRRLVSITSPRAHGPHTRQARDQQHARAIASRYFHVGPRVPHPPAPFAPVIRGWVSRGGTLLFAFEFAEAPGRCAQDDGVATEADADAGGEHTFGPPAAVRPGTGTSIAEVAALGKHV